MSKIIMKSVVVLYMHFMLGKPGTPSMFRIRLLYKMYDIAHTLIISGREDKQIYGGAIWVINEMYEEEHREFFEYCQKLAHNA